MHATTRIPVSALLVLTGVLQTEDTVAQAYAFDAVYTADVLSNVAGGIETGTRYLDNLDLTLEVDVNEAAGFGDGTLFVYGLYNNGSTFADELVGDLLVTSNIDAPEAWRIYELWYEFGDGPWSVRSGLYDLNSEFDVNGAGGLFLNSSHGIGAAFSQTGHNGPSIFPISSLAVRATWESSGYTARVAVLDGVPGDPDDPSSNEVDLSAEDGMLLVGELDVDITESTRLWTGYWHYTADFESFDGTLSDDNDGWYAGAEQSFAIGSRTLAWFLRYGQANERLNPLRAYAGAGVVVEGLLRARPEDRVGLSVASGRSGTPYRDDLAASGIRPAPHETQWELTYRTRINEHLALQPDIQFVQYPGAAGQYDDAWIVGMRLELSY